MVWKSAREGHKESRFCINSSKNLFSTYFYIENDVWDVWDHMYLKFYFLPILATKHASHLEYCLMSMKSAKNADSFLKG